MEISGRFYAPAVLSPDSATWEFSSVTNYGDHSEKSAFPSQVYAQHVEGFHEIAWSKNSKYLSKYHGNFYTVIW